jgi:hypothetical protein
MDEAATLRHLLALKTTPANEQDRAHVADLARQVQYTITTVEMAYLNHGYAGAEPEAEAAKKFIQLDVVKHHEAERGFVLLSRHWMVERTFACLGRFRRLARDYERLGKMLDAWHWNAPGMLLLGKAAFPSA